MSVRRISYSEAVSVPSGLPGPDGHFKYCLGKVFYLYFTDNSNCLLTITLTVPY